MGPPDEVNVYSQRFADRLFVAHPEWRVLAAHDPAGDPPPGSLLVTVPSPAGGRELALRTYGGQVTVGFGAHGWHEHFGPWSGRDEDAIFDAALAFVADLLADRVAVVVGMRGDRATWFRTLRPGDAPPRPPRRSKLLRRLGLGADRVEVYSWRGTRDATLRPEPSGHRP